MEANASHLSNHPVKLRQVLGLDSGELYLLIAAGRADAINQLIQIVNHFQNPSLVVTFLQSLVTDLDGNYSID